MGEAAMVTKVRTVTTVTTGTDVTEPSHEHAARRFIM
jgi:hypothetical protein